MLRYPLIHPPLLAALAATGHGSRVLLADANYAHATNVRRGASVIHLNLRPGLVRVDDVLELLVDAVPLEAVHAMRPDEGGEPGVFARYRELLGPALPIQVLPRFGFYQAAKEPDVAFAVATGDDRLYANLLLTIGYVVPV
ncbi:RbsD/FucU family protein [Microbispora triticiradicis]|uniref:RbsD or FucU transport n=2 Tax=Microbispora TaxID=2005 RepID=A0ABY3LR50_9ACTN|nr:MULTISPECIES: RbsD/FucU family protein [Microbispora]TLP63730.1 RbsD or FucU transport [Microbispora fusca]TYB47303.1 RbsD or FucU transport [Microbispora tritici]